MTTKGEILKLIRLNCLECCGSYVDEVKRCTSDSCKFHPFRLGKDPNPAKVGFGNKKPSGNAANKEIIDERSC